MDMHARAAATQDQLERVREAAEGLRQAEQVRRARGLLARLRSAWRGSDGRPRRTQPATLPQHRGSAAAAPGAWCSCCYGTRWWRARTTTLGLLGNKRIALVQKPESHSLVTRPDRRAVLRDLPPARAPQAGPSAGGIGTRADRAATGPWSVRVTPSAAGPGYPRSDGERR
jgi:hypothetical protein